MKFVQTICDKDNLGKVLLASLNSKLLHVEKATNIVNEDNNGKLLSVDNKFVEYLNSLNSIANRISLQLEQSMDCKKAYQDQEIIDFIKLIEDKLALADTNQQLKITDDDRIALDKLSEVDFVRMKKCHYINFGLGRIPNDSYKKLQSLKPNFVYVKLHTSNQYHWIAYATSDTFVVETNKILENLFLEPIEIPNIDVKKIAIEFKEHMQDMYSYCLKQSTIYRMYEYVALIDDKYILSGFVPQKDVETYKHTYDGLKVDFVEKDPSESGCEVPTLLKNNSFFKPFEMFVEMYSLPKYYDFDPTPFLAITYCILFGIMFGDLGQGLVLLIGGEILYRKSNKSFRLAGIVSRCGITSIIFGFLFGSVFGNEEILGPVHQSLFHVRHKLFEVMDSSSTMVLLIGAVLIGAVLILITMILNMYKNATHKKWGEVFFSQNGLAGFIFYGFILTAIGTTFLGGINLLKPVFIIIFIGIPVLCFFLKEPLTNLIEHHGFKPHATWGAFATETIFELLEIMLTFVSNSMSYLRVGGFVLSHAGMMLVVMTLVEMTGNAGPIVMVLGNIFVMCLEGLIVGIQTLRLEYYEMFSRYYDGNGKKYQILTSIE